VFVTGQTQAINANCSSPYDSALGTKSPSMVSDGDLDNDDIITATGIFKHDLVEQCNQLKALSLLHGTVLIKHFSLSQYLLRGVN